MTQMDFDRLAQTWLEDGPVEMPDRGLRAALDEIHVTRQRRFLRPTRMNQPAGWWVRIGAAAVVLIGIGVALGTLLPRDHDIGQDPSPTPAASPTAAPPTSGILSITDSFAPYRVTFPAREAWFARDTFVIEKETATLPGGIAIAVWSVANVYEDGCTWQDSLMNPPVGPTAEDLADALAGLADRETTAPVAVSVDGYPGFELEMTIRGVDFATCDEGQFRSWIGPTGNPRFHQDQGEHDRILILDVDGTRLLIFGRSILDGSFPGSHPVHVADLNVMLDSMQIEPISAGPSPTP